MTFSQYLVDLMRLIDGDEQVANDLPLNTLNQVIRLAEHRIYTEVRCRHNEKAFADYTTPVVVTDNLAPLPDDFESASVVHFGERPLLPAAENFVIDFNAAERTGDAIYFAVAGDSFLFAPPVADTTALQGRYYCRLPALDATTAPDNALFQAEPNLFIYGALAESGPIFKKSANEVAMWEGVYRAVRDRVNAARMNAAYSAGRAQRRPSTRVMR